MKLARKLGSRSALLYALGVALVYVLVAVSVSGRFGPTLDCSLGDYAYGEATWHATLTGQDPVDVYEGSGAPARSEPHPEFVSRFGWYQLFPLAATLSAASCDLFWARLGWLEPLPAHHLVNAVFVGALLFAMMLVLQRRTGIFVALLAVALLVSSPRFFADAQQNLKDIPEACLYSASALLFFQLRPRSSLGLWAGLGVLVGLALAQKQNALFLPVQLVGTAILMAWRFPSERSVPWRRLGLGVGVSLLGFIGAFGLASPWLWHDPARIAVQLQEIVRVSGLGSHFISFDGPWQVLLTTPLPLLLLGILGAVARTGDRRLRLLLVAWLAFVLGRLLLPGARNFNGVRHFLEFYPPLAMLAALGAGSLVDWLSNKSASTRWPCGFVATCAVAPGALAVYATFPYGSAYFNELAGGLDGAVAARVRDAGDYWCTSYLEGLRWIDQEGAGSARVLVPIAPEVAWTAAAGLERELLPFDATQPTEGPAFVMCLVQAGAGGTVTSALKDFEPAFEVTVQGAPILRVYRLAGPEQITRIKGLFQDDLSRRSGQERILKWALEQEPSRLPEILRVMRGLASSGLAKTRERLRKILPEQLHEEIDRGLEGLGSQK